MASLSLSSASIASVVRRKSWRSCGPFGDEERGQNKTPPALRHEEASASTEAGARSYVRRRLWVRSSFVMNRQVCQTSTRDATTMPEPRRRPRETGAVHKTVRRFLGIGLMAGIAYAVWRKLPAGPETGTRWEPQPFPFPPQPAIGVDVDDTPWVEAAESGACPAHHPVKAKLTSGISHV